MAIYITFLNSNPSFAAPTLACKPEKVGDSTPNLSRQNENPDLLGSKKVDPPQGSTIYTIGVLESRNGGSTCGILRGSNIRFSFTSNPGLPLLSKFPKSESAKVACM